MRRLWEAVKTGEGGVVWEARDREWKMKRHGENSKRGRELGERGTQGEVVAGV